MSRHIIAHDIIRTRVTCDGILRQVEIFRLKTLNLVTRTSSAMNNFIVHKQFTRKSCPGK